MAHDKDVLSVGDKLWSGLGSLWFGALAVLCIVDVQHGSRLGIYGLASLLAILDFGLSVRSDRLEKRVEALERKIKENK